MKNEQITAIRNKFDISYKEIAQYNNNHKNEIEQINGIFKLENGDNMEKTLALLYMLSLGEDDAAVKNYRNESGLTHEKCDQVKIIERYKYLLLSSLVFNDNFHTTAENYRGIVRIGLGIGLNKIRFSNEIEAENTELKNVALIFFIQASSSASTADHELKEVDHYHADNLFDLYSGDFLFYGNKQDRSLQVKFQFKDKDTGKPLDNAPCYFNVRLTINNTPFIFNLNKTMKGNPSVIYSSVKQPVDYSVGFKVEVLSISGDLNG